MSTLLCHLLGINVAYRQVINNYVRSGISEHTKEYANVESCPNTVWSYY